MRYAAMTHTTREQATRPMSDAAFSARACFQNTFAHEMNISVDTVLAVSIFVLFAVPVCQGSLSLCVLLPILLSVAVRITMFNLLLCGKAKYGKVKQDAGSWCDGTEKAGA